MKKIIVLLALTLAASSPLYGLKIIVKDYYGTALVMQAKYEKFRNQEFSDPIKPGYNEILGKRITGTKPVAGIQKLYWEEGWINYIRIMDDKGKTIHAEFNTDQLKSAVENGDLSDGIINIVIISPSEIFLVKNGVRQ